MACMTDSHELLASPLSEGTEDVFSGGGESEEGPDCFQTFEGCHVE